MNSPLEDVSFKKKNGAIHLRKCADFYGAKTPGTASGWLKNNAPILDPPQMRIWLQNKERDRLRKISENNRRHVDKEDEIVRLHTVEKLGSRAISKYFSGRPTIAGVREILIRLGVYRGDAVFNQQKRKAAKRRAAIIANEKSIRHQMAVCLWRLRKGTGVETTCKSNGWNAKSIWNSLRLRAAYKRYASSRKREWPDKRKYGKNYSRKFPLENPFKSLVIENLRSAGFEFVEECRLPHSRTRVDIRLSDETCIECKVAFNSGQTYEFIGQAIHYQRFFKRVVLCAPDDVEMRRDLFEIITGLGVIVCNQATIIDFLNGKPLPDPPIGVATQREVFFMCKCCESREKRRHRSNSYCIDCAKVISRKRYDWRIDRWVPNA